MARKQSFMESPQESQKHGDEALVQKHLESLKERVPEGEVEKLSEWDVSLYISSETVK